MVTGFIGSYSLLLEVTITGHALTQSVICCDILRILSMLCLRQSSGKSFQWQMFHSSGSWTVLMLHPQPFSPNFHTTTTFPEGLTPDSISQYHLKRLSSQLAPVQLNFLLITSQHRFHGRHHSQLLQPDYTENAIALLHRAAITWEWALFMKLLPRSGWSNSSLFNGHCLTPVYMSQ